MAKFGEKKLSEEEQKAREEQKQREKEKKQAIEATRLKNRKINFFIMRYMWQEIKGRSADDTIYLCFGMTRERYTRIIDTGKVRYRENEVEDLEHHTGIPRKIFTGEERFTCKNEKAEEIISSVTWDDFVNRRHKRIILNEKLKKSKEKNEANEVIENIEKALAKARKDYKIIEGQVEEQIKMATRKGDSSFHRLCAFLKNGYGIRLERLHDVYSALAYLGFDLLNECSKTELNQLSKALSQKMKMTNAVLMYRGARGDFKNK